MAKELFERRNQAVKVYFDELVRKYPQWRLDALEEKASERFFLQPRTIRAILKGEGNYGKLIACKQSTKQEEFVY